MGDLKIFPTNTWKDKDVGKSLLDALTSAADHGKEHGVTAFAVLVVSEDSDGQGVVFHRQYADTSADIIGLIGYLALGIRMDMLTAKDQKEE